MTYIAALDLPPPNCPFCGGQREWGDFPVADCYFCGQSAVAAEEEDE